MNTNYYYPHNTEDQRFFPLLPFLLGAAVSPYLYGHGYPYYGHYYPYYGPYNYDYGYYPYGYYY
ncbi:hypothetical protein CIB95_06690 [Lottiidibacillus patelloidae]|uniref:Uncharacterized protein n=1 Tax=Lottiidibacillus patelloidae TaxID=2670334 RepID=A0A263BTT2_9BACI|nr:hypothetical protein [Lottiidibacillus patelloidae]OZM57151.1 hypothetical protein CIB95_06690 [Lottiidibacillus patelloidae]